MIATQRGNFYNVQLSADDVAQWASRWPCFGERRPLLFQFDARNGDLVDLGEDESGMDDAGLAALANDAALAGAELLDLPGVAAIREPFADRESVNALCESALMQAHAAWKESGQ